LLLLPSSPYASHLRPPTLFTSKFLGCVCICNYYLYYAHSLTVQIITQSGIIHVVNTKSRYPKLASMELGRSAPPRGFSSFNAFLCILQAPLTLSLSLLSSLRMTDLTVLLPPSTLYVPQPRSPAFHFTRPLGNNVSHSSTPIMVTLEVAPKSPSTPTSPTEPKDNHLLSPPVNTWKSRPTRPRPASAPPIKTSFDLVADQKLADLSDIPPRPIFTNRRRNSSFSTSTRGGELIRPPPPLRESASSLLLNVI
jgi:hypothetical protein